MNFAEFLLKSFLAVINWFNIAIWCTLLYSAQCTVDNESNDSSYKFPIAAVDSSCHELAGCHRQWPALFTRADLLSIAGQIQRFHHPNIHSVYSIYLIFSLYLSAIYLRFICRLAYVFSCHWCRIICVQCGRRAVNLIGHRFTSSPSPALWPLFFSFWFWFLIGVWVWVWVLDSVFDLGLGLGLIWVWLWVWVWFGFGFGFDFWFGLGLGFGFGFDLGWVWFLIWFGFGFWDWVLGLGLGLGLGLVLI